MAPLRSEVAGWTFSRKGRARSPRGSPWRRYFATAVLPPRSVRRRSGTLMFPRPGKVISRDCLFAFSNRKLAHVHVADAARGFWDRYRTDVDPLVAYTTPFSKHQIISLARVRLVRYIRTTRFLADI